MSNTDFLRLNNHEIFENVRETLPKNIKKTQNVLVVKEDMLYTWDFQDNCLLTLNVKAVRNNRNEGIKHQTLVTTNPPLFTPNSLIVNDCNTLLAAVASNGVLVIELPTRSPPYGAFENNKELIYCRSHSLLESLAFNTNIEVRQVKFHIGSLQDTHLLLLTSNNVLRLFNIQDGNATCLNTYPIGVQPMGCFPKTKTTFLEALGDTAIDFDFGPPEPKEKTSKNSKDLTNQSVRGKDGVSTGIIEDINKLRITNNSYNNSSGTLDMKRNCDGILNWPIYILYRNGDIYVAFIELYERQAAIVHGPLPMFPKNEETYGEDSCSILCIHSTPTIICVSNSKGTVHHGIILDIDDTQESEFLEDRPTFINAPDRGLYVFECIELELGLTTSATDIHYNCPIYLHTNNGKLGHYFATHETGVHSININCIESLHKFIDSENEPDVDPDLFSQTSTAEYMVCTKISTSPDVNPVLGFSVYYEPPSIIVMLANGQVVTLALAALLTIPLLDTSIQNQEKLTSPLKKILSEPFDVTIQRILHRSTAQPILKTGSKGSHTQQECYELLQRAAGVLRERIQNHSRAKEEIEKRIKTLAKIKDMQRKDVERLKDDKQILQENAEALAEKYEDIKDKQEDITKRCEMLLVLIAKRQVEPSNAEKLFLNELTNSEKKVDAYSKAIRKLKEKVKYQELQMKNWQDQTNKNSSVGNVQLDAIKSNLQDMTHKITNMVAELNDYKKQMNLK